MTTDAKKIFFSPAENDPGFKRFNRNQKWTKPSVATELTLFIAMRTIEKITLKIILNFFVLITI
jgi:hypothetical protein